MRDIRAILVVLAVVILTGEASLSQNRQTLDLTGREVVVRVYRGGPQGYTQKYERTSFPIDLRTIRLEAKDANDSTLFKILGEDQKDPLISQIIAGYVHRLAYKKGLTFTLPISTAKLTGREAVVRVYKNWKTDKSTYEKYETVTQGGAITFDFADVNESAFVMVVGRDQKDHVVRLVTSERRFGKNYKKGLRYSIATKLSILAGREVVVRVYRDWRNDPMGFEQWLATVYQDDVEFDFDGVNDSAMVALFAADQQDELIKQQLGNRIYGWAYQRHLEFTIPSRPPADQNDYLWTFTDALGNPVPNADVQMYLTNRNQHIRVASARLDDQGQWRMPFCISERSARLNTDDVSGGSGTTTVLVVFSHPDYGSAEAKRVYVEKRHEHTVKLPLVQPASKAELRSAWGVVIDSDNNPVAGAFVEALGIYPPGGKWISGQRWCGVRTDAHGRFVIYVPMNTDKIGSLIPPKSEYYLKIKPPHGLGLLEYKGRVPNGRENIITLESPQEPRYFHTFVFEDENGPITDKKVLEDIVIKIRRRDKPDEWLKYSTWKEGGNFLLGRYEAKTDRSELYQFKPIEVTANTPEQLLFKLPPGKSYFGRIVDGINGEPMEGAFVRAGHSAGCRSLAEVTPEQWELLHQLPDTNAVPKEISGHLRYLLNFHSRGHLIRTDSDGWFEMQFPPKNRFRGFSVFQKNYLTMQVHESLARSKENGQFDFSEIKLFPAATAVVEPRVQGVHKDYLPHILPVWILGKDSNPKWMHDLLAACDDEDDAKGILNEFCVEPNQTTAFYIPAGLNLQLQLTMPMVAHRKWSPMTIAENINLQQGQVLDFGRVELRHRIKMFVQVLNWTGQGVEGVPVKALCDRYEPVTHNSDEDGYVSFDLARDSKGEFIVEYNSGYDADQVRLHEAIPYEVVGPQDANSIFTLQVSDEILQHLFK